MDLALFDFDGTLTTQDTFRGFIYLSSGPLRTAAGNVALAPLVLGYRRGVVSGSVLRRAAAAFCFRGRAAEDIERHGRQYARQLDECLRPEAMSRLRWHQQQGHRVAIVSASLSAYLRPWADSVGVDLICNELEARGGVHTGRLVDGDCSREEKARRVRARYVVGEYERIYAYGDTPEDHALLRLASRRYFRGREVDPSVPVESLVAMS